MDNMLNSHVMDEREEQSREETQIDSMMISNLCAFSSGKSMSHRAQCGTVASPQQEGTGDDSTDKQKNEGEKTEDKSTSTLVSLPLTFFRHS